MVDFCYFTLLVVLLMDGYVSTAKAHMNSRIWIGKKNTSNQADPDPDRSFQNCRYSSTFRAKKKCMTLNSFKAIKNNKKKNEELMNLPYGKAYTCWGIARDLSWLITIARPRPHLAIGCLASTKGACWDSNARRGVPWYCPAMPASGVVQLDRAASLLA